VLVFFIELRITSAHSRQRILLNNCTWMNSAKSCSNFQRSCLPMIIIISTSSLSIQKKILLTPQIQRR